MRKEIRRFKNFSFFLKIDKELSQKEKAQMHNLLVKTYPVLRRWYNKHGYYSTVKPQMNFLIKKDDVLVGTGKFLWRKIKINNRNLKLFAFGMIIATKYRKRGLGTYLGKLTIKEAKQKKADLLYSSTSNLVAEKILEKLGFKKIKTPVFYKDSITKKIKKERNFVYALEFKKNLVNKINNLPKFFIGIGPI